MVGGVEEIISEGLRLGAHFARPAGARTRARASLVLPGFPRGPGGAATVGNTYASLVDRIAREAGWAALTFTIRGTGTSEGDFSIEGWLADVRAAIDALHARTDVTGVWLAGFRLGGTLAIVAAAHDDRVCAGSRRSPRPRRCRTWVHDPAWFLEYARRTGVLRTPDYPPDPARVDPRDREPRRARRRRGASRRARGCSCTAPTTTSSRSRTRARCAEAGGDCVELRIVPNGPHRLRHDPRAIAALLGWLDRQGP